MDWLLLVLLGHFFLPPKRPRNWQRTPAMQTDETERHCAVRNQDRELDLVRVIWCVRPQQESCRHGAGCMGQQWYRSRSKNRTPGVKSSRTESRTWRAGCERDGIDGYVTARNARMIFFRRPDAISAALPANHLGRVMTMRWQ